jgi:enoyl-CoA hydratase/carnithine racemase
VEEIRDNYFTAYRNPKMARDAQGVLVVQLHNNGGPLTFTSAAHTEVVDAFYRISQDRANKIVILTGASGDFMIGVDWASLKNVSDPGAWSQIHDEESVGVSNGHRRGARTVGSRGFRCRIRA